MATVELPHYDLSIAGSPVPSAGGRFYDTVDPYTGEPWARVPDADEQDVDRAVAAARAAFEGEWGALTGFQRAKLMHRLADLIERDAERLAELETRDNGKLLREMSGQLRLPPRVVPLLRGLGGQDRRARACPSDRPNYFVYTRQEPVGVVAAIVPWNSPLLLLTWKLAPALAAGCTVVIKPSDHTPVTALELAKLVTEAGFPAGVFNVVTGNGPDVGRALVRHPGVDKVAFTGSTKTGIDVAAGATSHLARVTLELGGKSAQVVFADADLEAAANGVIAGVFAATGQTCMAGSRLVVHEDVHDELVERIAERARDDRARQPARSRDRDGPAGQRAAVREGDRDPRRRQARGRHRGLRRRPGPRARRLLHPAHDPHRRRRRLDRGARGDLRAGAAASWRSPTRTRRSRKANDHPYGLAAGVWTLDVRRAHRVAARLRAGTVWINAYRVVGAERAVRRLQVERDRPRERLEVLREYLETKAVWVELSGATRDPFVLG